MPSLVAALDAAIRDSTGAFVIDLCDVEFLDSSGLGALLRARAMLGRDDRALAVACPPGPVRRLFEVSEEHRALVYYAALLIDVDCHPDAHEQAKWFGDNIALKSIK